MRKDKQKVLDEVLTDEQIRGFLAANPPVHVAADHNCLIKAYRGLVARDFARFVEMFVAEGRDLNAPNEFGETVLDVVATHESFAEYAEILRGAGARTASGS